jgi:hypothetical protein
MDRGGFFVSSDYQSWSDESDPVNGGTRFIEPKTTQ